MIPEEMRLCVAVESYPFLPDWVGLAAFTLARPPVQPPPGAAAAAAAAAPP